MEEKDGLTEGNLFVLFVTLAVIGASVTLCLIAFFSQTYYLRLRHDTIKFNFKKNSPFKREIENSLREGLEGVDGIDLRCDGLARVAKALLSSGWVRRLLWVRIEGRRLRAGVLLRRPFAGLKRGKQILLVDRYGNTIPCLITRKRLREAGLLLVSARGVVRWEKAALRICHIVYENTNVFDAYGVAIREVRATSMGRFSLVSADGRIFEWGYAPGGPGVDYLSVKEKLSNLELVLRNPEAKRCGKVVLWSRPVGQVSNGPTSRYLRQR